MLRILNFFAIGLLVGLAVFYQIHRNQQLENEILTLRAITGNSQPNARAWSKDQPLVAAPKFMEAPDDTPKEQLNAELYTSRATAVTSAVAKTSDAVVGINVVQLREVPNRFLPSDPLGWMLFDERMMPRTIKQKVQNLGSGFIISPDGYIVTNEHVIRDASEVWVTTTARHRYAAAVVGTDPLTDMALLKIEATDLPIIPMGNSDNAMVGEWAIAMGNPYGLFDVNDQPSVSVGVISALHRDFESEIDGRIYTDMIQTDAAINRGNSGGPILTADGKAIGMNTLIVSESGGSVGIGFAIPSNRIVATIDDLLKGGVNRKFWIGIRALDLSNTYARIQGLTSSKGAIVTNVEPGSPAAKAGIQLEDIILEICDRQVESARSAAEILKSTDLRVGDRMTMKICRKRKVFTVTMTLVALPQEGKQGG
jgi:serine protease Do